MYLVIKRIVDLVFATMALLFLSPIFFLVILILKLTGEGEVFYLQLRPGLHGKVFKLIKFATMMKNSSSIGTGNVTIKNDPRVLPFGMFLRKTKINEIPQLLNIFKGDMSFVGPRPLPIKNFEIYTYEAQKIIERMKPGLTGVGSVVFRNEEEIIDKLGMPLEKSLKEVIMPYKAKLEEWYYENQSITMYFKIIFITAWIVVFPESKIINFLIPDIPGNIKIDSLQQTQN
jgi:lipopolysaccharide/colanic/teichoic acid biosynthesis glycosyltransferase